MEEDFVSWPDKSLILLNEEKKRDMSTDFRKSSSAAAMTIIESEKIQLVERYKYLGTVLDKDTVF